MKKTLVALAALAATSAFAQSSVTLYGVIDQGVYAKKSVGPAGGVAGAANATYKIQGIGDDESSSHGEGTLNGSRLGFKGTEDLGGGLTASFQIEMGLFPSEKSNSAAASTSPMRQRNTFVALAGNFGEVKLGRIYTHVWATQASHDQGGNNGLYGWNAGLAGSGNRQANVLQYTAPTVNGVTASVFKGYGQTITDSAAAAGAAGADKLDEVTSFGLAYANGPLTANFAYETTSNHTLHDMLTSDTKRTVLAAGLQLVGGVAADFDTPGEAPDTTVTAFGGTYDFKVAKVSYVNQKMKIDKDTGTDLTLKTSGFSVGIPVGKTTYFASSSTAKNNAATEVKHAGSQLGAVYDLSKRTALYAILGNNKLTAGADSVKFTSSAFGVRHSF